MSGFEICGNRRGIWSMSLVSVSAVRVHGVSGNILVVHVVRRGWAVLMRVAMVGTGA
jgi:hypothetical protein